MVDKYYWLLSADNILVNGQDIGLCKFGCQVIADTGTSLITGPSNDLMRLIDDINIDENCKGVKSLPKLTFIIDSIHYDLGPSDYVLKIDSDGNELPYNTFASTESMVELGEDC